MYEESHPIPQNVTSFEFHLVGDMTLKQFGFLAAGLVTAYLTFVILFSAAPVIAVPIIVISALLGVAFAFLPVFDRPLDHWVKAYFKAVYSPTQAKWQPPTVFASEDEQSQQNLFQNRLQYYLSATKPQTIITPVTTSETVPVVQPSTQEQNVIQQENPYQLPKLEFKKIDAESVRTPETPHPPTQAATIPSLRPLKPQTTVVKTQNITTSQVAAAAVNPNSNIMISTLQQQANQLNNSLASLQNGLDFNPAHNPPLHKMQFVFTPPASLPTVGKVHSQPVSHATTQVSPNVQHPAFIPPTQTVYTQPRSQVDRQPSQTIHTTHSPQVPKAQPIMQTTPTSILSQTRQKIPSSEELNKIVSLAQQARNLQLKLAEAEKHINQLTTAAASPEVANENYKQQFQQIFGNLQTLIQQADILSKQVASISKNTPNAKKPVVKVVEPPKQKSAQILLTSQPNVINGIVTDAEGNYLEGVIVIIHDKNNLPVRALKTNKIGQFTGATPLPQGDYTITLEKDNLEFDTLQVTLNGEVMPPLQISAKKASLAGII